MGQELILTLTRARGTIYPGPWVIMGDSLPKNIAVHKNKLCHGGAIISQYDKRLSSGMGGGEGGGDI